MLTDTVGCHILKITLNSQLDFTVVDDSWPKSYIELNYTNTNTNFHGREVTCPVVLKSRFHKVVDVHCDIRGRYFRCSSEVCRKDVRNVLIPTSVRLLLQQENTNYTVNKGHVTTSRCLDNVGWSCCLSTWEWWAELGEVSSVCPVG